MTFADELVKIRRYLRDPEGNIWGVDLIIELFNQAQHDLQLETAVLEDVAVISIPPKYTVSYLHDFESAFIDGAAYRPLRQQQDFFACVYRGEAQDFFGIESDVTDSGTINFTHPFEAWIEDPNMAVKFNFPDNLSAVRQMWFDNKAIDYKDKKQIQLTDSSWETRAGIPLFYYREDESSNQFVPYPRPSSASWNDETGSGMVTSVEDDTTASEDGTIIQRTGNVLSSDLGVAVTVLDTDDNFAIVYEISPSQVDSIADDLDWPDFLVKYVRFRTLELAYQCNNDGNIPSLAAHWGRRYRMGIGIVNRFLSARNRDRDYRLKTHDRSRPSSNYRGLRLPDTYPAV